MDKFDTFPIEIKKMIKSMEGLIYAYINENKKIETKNTENNHFGNSSFKNIYYDEVQKLCSEIYDILIEENFSILFFHFTRLFDEEIHNLKLYGLKIYNQKEYKEKKLFVLQKHGYSREEINSIWSKALIQRDEFRENKIYFFYSLSAFDENLSFLLNWGGEILSQSNLDKANKDSLPYIILKRIKVKNICCKEDLKGQIKAMILNEFLQKKELFDSSYVIESDVKIDSIIQTDNECTMFSEI